MCANILKGICKLPVLLVFYEFMLVMFYLSYLRSYFCVVNFYEILFIPCFNESTRTCHV